MSVKGIPSLQFPHPQVSGLKDQLDQAAVDGIRQHAEKARLEGMRRCWNLSRDSGRMHQLSQRMDDLESYENQGLEQIHCNTLWSSIPGPLFGHG
jgi:hypothetical protein